MEIEVRLLQPINANSPIEMTESGIEIVVGPLQPEKA